MTPIKLTELEPQFVRYETRDGVEYTQVEGVSFAAAQGIWFLCPVCFQKNNGPVGTHGIDVTFVGRGALDNQGSHNRSGQPSRWMVSGDSFENLSLSPSIDIGPDGCAWHGYITNGVVT